MLDEMKQRVYEANLELFKRNLVTFTWGNVSEIDREKGLIVIKPSGVEYNKLSPLSMVVMDLDGNIAEGELNPSSDTATHIELYKAFEAIGGITHTHSPYAVSWAQAGRNIPCYGTTHADYFYGAVPCTRNLSCKEIEDDYEKNTGIVIIETFTEAKINPLHMPAVICRNHGPFTWGKDAMSSVHSSVVLEEVSRIAFMTEMIDQKVQSAAQCLQDKHFNRKHGKNAYYGQR